jgi:hypothetical protein
MNVLMATALSGCISYPPVSSTTTGDITQSTTKENSPMPRPWMFGEARLPAGFPPPGPVGQIIIKQYPAYRAAMVSSQELGGASQNSMFRPLFDHIQKNNISMTAPVEIGYADSSPDKPKPVSMAFLYGDPQIGQSGRDGKVQVVDLPAMTVVSIGVRGSYSEEHYADALAKLREWVAANASGYLAIGPPRYLGYNSPFVPWFLRYGEVQVPISSQPT